MLDTKSQKEQREEYKNKAVVVRESGNLKEALSMFEEVQKWDEENSNTKGLIDVLGHIRIVYSRLAEESLDKKEKEILNKKAFAAAERALKVGEDNSLDSGALTVQKVHFASALLTLAQSKVGQEKIDGLNKALKIVEEAFETLPGSKAHKAWPLNLKGKILFELGKSQEAVAALLQGEAKIYEGYEEEIKKDDQPEIKLNVWLSGIHLTLAYICQKEGKDILAKHYAASVLAIEDPNNVLGERKKEAKRILKGVMG